MNGQLYVNTGMIAQKQEFHPFGEKRRRYTLIFIKFI